MPRTDIPVIDKRVVLTYLTGPRAGLRQILGCVSELQATFRQPGLPAFVPGVDFITHKGAAELVAQKDRYVQYQETVSPVVEDDGA